MPEEVVAAKAENELPTISKDKPELVQETNLQLEKSKVLKNDEKSKNGKSIASKNTKSLQQRK